MTISHVGSSDRSCTMTNVHRLCRSLVLAMLSAFREGGKVWELAVVRSAHVNPRSYLVQSQHGQLRRNRRQLSKTNELPPVFLPAVETSSVDHPLTTPRVDAPQLREVPAAPPEPADTQETLVTHDRVTRSCRIIKTPTRYR